MHISFTSVHYSNHCNPILNYVKGIKFKLTGSIFESHLNELTQARSKHSDCSATLSSNSYLVTQKFWSPRITWDYLNTKIGKFYLFVTYLVIMKFWRRLLIPECVSFDLCCVLVFTRLFRLLGHVWMLVVCLDSASP